MINYECFIDRLELPDPDDRHVLAAAIEAGAQLIVTSNTKDLPQEALRPFGVEAQHPDDFTWHLRDYSPRCTVDAIEQARRLCTRPPYNRSEHLEILRDPGLVETVESLLDPPYLEEYD